MKTTLGFRIRINAMAACGLLAVTLTFTVFLPLAGFINPLLPPPTSNV
jgi:hypothetical protein